MTVNVCTTGLGPLTITLPVPRFEGEVISVHSPQGELARFEALQVWQIVSARTGARIPLGLQWAQTSTEPVEEVP